MGPTQIPDEIAAGAFWRLVRHLQHRTAAQNVDLMGLAGFCRNCLSQWLEDESQAKGLPVDRDAAREAVYGMPYADWKVRYQKEATSEQLQRMEESVARNPE